MGSVGAVRRVRIEGDAGLRGVPMKTRLTTRSNSSSIASGFRMPPPTTTDAYGLARSASMICCSAPGSSGAIRHCSAAKPSSSKRGA